MLNIFYGYSCRLVQKLIYKSIIAYFERKIAYFLIKQCRYSTVLSALVSRLLSAL